MGNENSRTCTRCGTHVEWEPDEKPAGCATCIHEWEHRKDPREMTLEERLTEWDSWGPILEIPFDKLQQRLQELAGRPIWTHELADPDRIRKEMETGEYVSMADIINKLPQDKTLVVVLDSNEQPTQ